MKTYLFRLFCFGVLCVSLSSSILVDDFLDQQKKFARVRLAIKEKQTGIEKDLAFLGMDKSNYHLLLVAFKEEKELQLYVKKNTDDSYTWLKTYPICASSGSLGPKEKQGDGQVPEGFYHIDRFNPYSNFFLSLGINYPNLADKRRNTASNLGGDIFIHGNCVTIGCLPMTDENIKEIYLHAVFAKNNGQVSIPVLIFPFKMYDAEMKEFEKQYTGNEELISFWKNIKSGFDNFTRDHKALKYTIAAKGTYTFL